MVCHQTDLEDWLRYLATFHDVTHLNHTINSPLYVPSSSLFFFIFLGFLVFLTTYYQLLLLLVVDIMALLSWYGYVNTSISLWKQFSKYLSSYAFLLLLYLLTVTLDKLDQYKANACSLNSTITHPFELDNSSYLTLNYWPRRVQ